MIRRVFFVGYCGLAGNTWLGGSAHAEEGLQLRPLMYRETLTAGQIKRGVLDIANSSTSKVSIHISVKLFRQKADDGTLEFYDKPDATAGIVPDYTDVDLEGKDALRLGFTVDGSKLSQGDVFAAIFATTAPTPQTKQAIQPAVSVGTLLILQNGTAGPRHAEITQVDLSPLQIGATDIRGEVSVKDPADANKPTGFFPQMKISVTPWGATTQFEGPLIYAGHTRTFDFSVPSDQFGIYQVNITANDATTTNYVLVMTGKWRFLVPIVIGVLFLGIAGWIWWRRRRTRSSMSRRR